MTGNIRWLKIKIKKKCIKKEDKGSRIYIKKKMFKLNFTLIASSIVIR